VSSKIIVCKEKHITRYWDASTNEVLYASSLAILKYRFEDGTYYEPEYYGQPPGQLTYELELELAIVDAMPDCETKTAALEHIHKQMNEDDKKYGWFMDEMQEWRAIKRAIATSNSKLAYRILQLRSGNEYEGFEVEELENSSD